MFRQLLSFIPTTIAMLFIIAAKLSVKLSDDLMQISGWIRGTATV